MSGLYPSAPSAADPQQGPRALLRLISGHVCLHASMAGMRLAAPLWALQHGYGPLAVGFLLALFSLSQVFLALPAGRFADRHGLRKPVSRAVVAATIGASTAVVFPHFVVLCFAALMMGGATGAASIALQRHVGRAAADATDLRRVFSWLSIGPAISNFLGPVCAGLLIDYAGVWLGGSAADRNGFVAAFALTALLPSLAWLCVRSTRELEPIVHEGGVAPSAWPLLKEPIMRRLLLVNWLLSSCWLDSLSCVLSCSIWLCRSAMSASSAVTAAATAASMAAYRPVALLAAGATAVLGAPTAVCSVNALASSVLAAFNCFCADATHAVAPPICGVS